MSRGGDVHNVLGRISDEELVRRSVARDEQAFTTLISRHRALMYAVCLRITGDPEDALEALQDTLLRAWRALPRFRGESLITSWLHRIAVNASYAECARRNGRPTPVAHHDLAWPGREFDGEVLFRLDLEAALRRLPSPYRAVMVLRESCGCSYDEIAEILGVPVNTVKSRLSRARRALAHTAA